MTHKLIVFDWNGTLLADTLPSLKASNACLEFYGRPPITMERFRETFNFPILHFYKLNGISTDEMLARKEESNIVFQSSYEALAANTRLRKGARELLQWCNDQGHTCMILSNYMTDKITAHLHRLKIRHHFADISAHDCDGTTILHKTTKAQRLSEYMLKRNYKPAETIIIGDSTEEPEIARQLGLTSIGITDGAISRPRLKKAAPNHMINTLSQCKPLIQ